jgi:hypothetical protein
MDNEQTSTAFAVQELRRAISAKVLEWLPYSPAGAFEEVADQLYEALEQFETEEDHESQD